VLELFVKVVERLLQLVASIGHAAHGSTEPTPRIKAREVRVIFFSGGTPWTERLVHSMT
jgi:hypothetical protein